LTAANADNGTMATTPRCCRLQDLDIDLRLGGEAVSEVLARVWRGALVECVHRGGVAIVDVDGELLAGAGDPELMTYMRSSAKPLQAMTLCLSGAVERFGLQARHLAVACASHTAEPEHVAAVTDLLQAVGLDESRLECGSHRPIDRRACEELFRSGGSPTAVHSNCSGKHAGMLAAAKALGLPLDDYWREDHPLQQQIMATVAEFTGVPPGRMIIGIDGCGVPVYGLPLRAMARSFALLANPDCLPARLRSHARRIVAAMQEHPHLVGGTHRLDTDLLEQARPRLVVKSGAEGLLCLGVLGEHCPGRAVGLAIKIDDGNGRGIGPVATEILARIGVLDEADLDALERHHRPRVKNFRQEVVGRLEATVPLRATPAGRRLSWCGQLEGERGMGA